mgnify:CR=1 FL=1
MPIFEKIFMYTLICLYFYPQFLSAEEKIKLKPVIVRESVFSTDMYNPVIPLFVVTKDEITNKRPLNTLVLLSKIPGINIDRTSARGNISSIYLRNAEANFTAIYIDGIKVNNPTNSRGGGYNFSLLDVNSINKIEIAKGPASSIGGSDALAGIINISTFDETSKENISNISYGSRGYYNVSINAGNVLGKYQYDLYASNSNDGSPNDGSSFKRDALNLLVRKKEKNSDLKFKINSNNSFSSYFPDDSGGVLFSEKRDLEYKDTNGVAVSVNYQEEFNDLINYSAQASYYYEQEDLASPGVNPGIGNSAGISKNSSDSRYSIYSLFFKNNFKVNDDLNIILGLDIETGKSIIDSAVEISGANSLSKDTRKRTTYSPFISAKYKILPDVLFLTSFRFDLTNNFEDNISPKIGLSYDLSNLASTITLSWGRGFKLPSFYSLGNALVGNSALVPEKSTGTELNFSGHNQSNTFQYSLNLFAIEYKNLIDFDSNTFSLVNRSKLNTDGIELLVKYSLSNNFFLNTHLTYIHSDLDVPNVALRHRPNWKGGIEIQWNIKPGIYLNLDSTYIDNRYDSSVVTDDKLLPSYVKFDLSAHFKLNSDIDFNFGIDNLFDKNYQEAIGFLARGITPRAALSIKF